MENPSRLEVNWQVLSDELVTLKNLKDQAVKQMDLWLQNVQISERRVEELGKEINELTLIATSHKRNYLTAQFDLNWKVNEYLEAIKVLKARMDIKSKSIDTELIEQAKEKPKQFSEEDLKGFTKGFDTPIGSGGFGIVYKGEFPSGEQIAVKVLTAQNVPDELFMEEVRITGMTSHPNLIKLYGFCCDGNMRGLVYEYMKNGSLDGLLYKDSLPIEWDKLYDIMIHTADGISYLHEGCKERIIHHDIKPANILLDSKFFPKLADFGLAKHIERDLTHLTVSGPKGTRGYVAPEMLVMPFSHVTYTCDVYSFGMMLFDVLGSINGNAERFPEKVWKKFEKNKLNEIIEDCGIKGKNKENAEILCMVAFWCIQFTPHRRPSMGTVVKMLKKEVQVEMPGNPFLPFSDPTNLPSRERNEDPIQQREPTAETLSILIKYMIQDSRVYQGGKPVAAHIIYKCVSHWDSNAIRDKLIHMIVTAIENHKEKYCLPYWLSNITILLGLALDTWKLFFDSEQLLENCAKKIYSSLCDNLKKDITSFLSLFIGRTTTSVSITSINNDSPISSWQPVVDTLSTYLRKLQENFVSSYLIESIFSETFDYINVELFNSLMLHRECCSFSNGENLEAGLILLQSWCAKGSRGYAASSWEKLQLIRVATHFLVQQEKSDLSTLSIKVKLSELNYQQRYTLSRHCWDEKNNANCVHDLRLSDLELDLKKTSSKPPLFLEYEPSTTFHCGKDTLKRIRAENLALLNVTPDVELLEYSAFQFLKE